MDHEELLGDVHKAVLLRGFAGAIGPAQVAVVDKMRAMNFSEEDIEAVRGAVSDRLNKVYFNAKEGNE